jgi:hypothetical protein
MHMRNYPPSLFRESLFAAAVAFTALSALAATPGPSTRIEPVVRDIGPDTKLIQFANGVIVEQLRSQAARAHLDNVKRRHPDGFAASRADLLARGFVPSTEVYVERTYHQAATRKQSSNGRRQPNNKQYDLAQNSSEQNSDGEIIFESYEGPGDTWQGTIYMELYADGAATSWSGQIDTSTSEYPYNWATIDWSYAGDDRGPIDLTSMRQPPIPGAISRAASIQYASWKPGQTVFPVAVNWYNWAYCWRSAVVGGCTTAAIGCIRVTVAWPACFATWCIGAEVAGAVVCAMQNWH